MDGDTTTNFNALSLSEAERVDAACDGFETARQAGKRRDRRYVIDLGLAKSLDATEYTTLSGRPLGTPEFMSPEQARGRKDVHFATDVYGLGATLFALLTGCPPFGERDEPQLVVLRKVMEEEPNWPREQNKRVGHELKAICLKCLEKDPAKRLRSAGELAVALNKYLNHENTGVTLPGPWSRLVKWVKRQPWRAAAVASGGGAPSRRAQAGTGR